MQQDAESHTFLNGGTLDWLQPVAVQERRAGLNMLPGSLAAEFAEKCEFISLGCTCQISRGLQALGVKRWTYPFDWVQSPLSGVIHLFRTDFEDFLTCTLTKDAAHIGEKMTYTRARWGGSFWHHDVEDLATRDAFERRIHRLLGMRPEVPASQARVFVRTASSTLELDQTLQLYDALKDALPDCRLYLLMIVDLQDTEGLIALECRAGLDVLFFRAHERVFAEEGSFDRKQVAENYARGVACAISVWASGARSASLPMEPSLAQVSARCDQMDSGDPGSEGFWPRRFRGQRFTTRRVSVPKLFQEKQADFIIPQGSGEGRILTMNAFGIEGIQTQVPAGGVAGQVIRLKMAEGCITAGLLTTVTVAAAMAPRAVTRQDSAIAPTRVQTQLA